MAEGAGRVVLVGAGPGAPGLLTLAALEALRAADVILYDRLAGPAFRRFVRPATELVDVGKRPGASAATQEEICRRLVSEAAAGRTAVRVKGGDPFVFGRGYEEVLACLDAGVAVEVVPGVSSALAAPGLGGVPLTHRGFAPGFTVLSGHEDPAKTRPAVDWAILAALGTPIVILMGVATIGEHARVLVDAGMASTTPVVAVEAATTPQQRTVRATLGDCEAVFAAEDVTSPAVIVVGANAALGAAWGDAEVGTALAGAGDWVRDVSGWRVVVADRDGDGDAVAAALAGEGALVRRCALGDPPGVAELATLVEGADCLVLTSPAAQEGWVAMGSPLAPVVVAPAAGRGVHVVAGPEPASVVAALGAHARGRADPG